VDDRTEGARGLEEPCLLSGTNLLIMHALKPPNRDVEPMDFDNDSDEQHKLEAELTRLRVEHGDLNDAISALEKVGGTDQLQIQRFKRRKLLLKDQISKLEDRLTPDIIA